MANNKSNVSVGKPNVAGAIYCAPEGTPLPSDATTALDAAYIGFGYVSEDGLTNAMDISTENITAWGGDVVIVTRTATEETIDYTLIESINAEVLKHIYGDANVSESAGAISIMHRQEGTGAPHVMVVELILTGNRKKRIVIPSGVVSSVGDVTYVDGEAIGYETTLTCQADANGVTIYEYISAAV